MNFADVIEAIRVNNPDIGRYGGTLVSSIRKLQDKCDPEKTGDFVLVVNDHEKTFKCLRAVTRNDKTLKSNISHIVGVVRRYVPGLVPKVKSASLKFWNSAIADLDKRIREGDPENDMGEDPSWRNLTWRKIVDSKKKLEFGTFERLAMDVYTSAGVPPRRGEWANVVVYSTEHPKERPPEQNWIFLPKSGNKGAFVEFNSFKTKKHTNSQRIPIPAELVKSVRETVRRNSLELPSNLFGFDNFSMQSQSNKFNTLLMRALNRALERTDIKRPANLFRHTFLTDVFHNRLSKLSDTDLKTILRNMGTSLEQAMFTYRIVKQSGGGGGEGGSLQEEGEGSTLASKLAMLNSLLEDLDPQNS